MHNEPHLRYCVEKRYRKPPPAPYENPWRLEFSFGEINDAIECAREDEDGGFYVRRVVDSESGNEIDFSELENQ